jgi:REP element-mobilizing transposase RayT
MLLIVFNLSFNAIKAILNRKLHHLPFRQHNKFTFKILSNNPPTQATGFTTFLEDKMGVVGVGTLNSVAEWAWGQTLADHCECEHCCVRSFYIVCICINCVKKILQLFYRYFTRNCFYFAILFLLGKLIHPKRKKGINTMARIKRIKAEGKAFYHIISRITNKSFLLKNREIKQVFINMLYKTAEFSGVDVVTYVVMDNHFHLCVKIEKEENLTESEILRRIGILYGENQKLLLEKQLILLRENNEESLAIAKLERFHKRMGDLSEFVKTFKQRLSQWYNTNYNHQGTLWEGRFKSVLVEDGTQLHNLVSYIHQNPIRAKIVENVIDYEFSAPGAAAKGDKRALNSLSMLGIYDSENNVQFKTKDSRFSNCMILGNSEFVKNMATLHTRCFGNVKVKVKAHILGLLTSYATHGQRSGLINSLVKSVG